MPKIFIDNIPYEAGAGRNLLHAVLSLGFDLPYFCWHPALHSVGACRQCAVKQFKDEQDTKGRIVMACMTPAAEGTRISINDAEAKAFRANVIEWLMTNHPHDCPVCDEGGECHLQDMTVMSGHAYRRFRFQKRTFTNQYLGPFINHEMNRCITCYRCVRFYNDYAGGKDLGAFAIRNMVYFGRQEDGVLENEFSGNLIEVCPTGVFTDKTFKRHYTRKWDLQSSPSICHHCSLGCNTSPGERYGVLRRIRNRYNDEINGYFLCDRGRFGYEFVNDEQRIRHALYRPPGADLARIVARDEALERLKALIRESKRIVAVGSPRASVESNFAMKSIGKSGQFSNGMTRTETELVKKIADILRSSPMTSASIRDIEESDAVFVLGEDLTNTAPRMALAVRQAARTSVIREAAKLGIPEWNDAAIRTLDQEKRGPVIVAGVCESKLDEIAEHVFHGAPDDLARLGFAVANALGQASPAVDGLSEEASRTARDIASVLVRAEHPVVIAGVSQKSGAVIEAASNIARALSDAGKKPAIAYALGECNEMGSVLMEGVPLDDLIAPSAGAGSEADLLIICENDLYRRMSQSKTDALLASFKHVVVLDHSTTLTTAEAELVLPSASYGEGSGTLINNEGRAQRFFSVFIAGDDMEESWRWIASGLSALDEERKRPWNTLDEILQALAADVPALSTVAGCAPGSDFRVEGQKIPRETPGFSGRTAVQAHQSVSEPMPPEDRDSALSFSMEGYPGQPPPALTSFVWAPGWNSVQATTKYQSEAGGPLLGGDPGVNVLLSKTNESGKYFTDIPPAFASRESEYLPVYLYHIFGSEEMSVRSPGIIERMPAPYCAMNREDVASRSVNGETDASLDCTGEHLSMPMKIVEGLPKGVIGFPWGLPGSVRLAERAWVKFIKK